MTTCSSWFLTKVATRNTVGAWAACFEVGTAIARHIQSIVVNGASEKQVDEVVKASNELCAQVGF